MTLFRKFSILLYLIFLTGCILKKNFDVLSDFEPHLIYKGDYISYLGLEYLDFARKLRSVEDFESSEYFSKKGLAAITDSEIALENPLDWDADKSQVQLMILMQTRMESLMRRKFLQKSIPIQLSHLVFLYDCWVSTESRAIFVADDLARCRVRFIKLLNEVEYYLTNLNNDKTEPVKIKEPEFELFRVKFDYDSFQLNDKAFHDLYQALSYLESLDQGFKLLLVGNTDRSGSRMYNKILSLNRVLTIKKYLMSNGISEDLIKTEALGEEFPEIVTFDGKSNQPNRSVEIYVITGIPDEIANTLPVPLVKNQVYQKEIRKAREMRGLEN